MKRNYNTRHRLVAYTLFISLFLQNCSGLKNVQLNEPKKYGNTVDASSILDQKFVAEGGHLVSFYQMGEDIKSNVIINPLDEKDKLYEEVDVVLEKGVNLDNLIKLDKKTQQKRIQIQFSDKQRGKPKTVVVHKPWVMGGSPDEVIVFLGNPGAGKSTICNSIFGQAIFKSGISRGTGLTTEKQEHIYDNKLYIDTPGLRDAEKSNHAAIAREIESALKKNNNYKIVFVATLEAGRIKYADLETINTICDSIQIDFEYGLIFNKVTDPVYEDIMKNGMDEYLITLHKNPSLVALLKKVKDMEDRADKYFRDDSENKEKLLSFLFSLRANRIQEDEVKKIVARDVQVRMQARIQEMEDRQKRELAERNQRIAEQQREINSLSSGFSFSASFKEPKHFHNSSMTTSCMVGGNSRGNNGPCLLS